VRKTLAISRAVIADAIRRKVVWVVIVFAAVLALAVPALPSYGVGVVSGVFREVTISLMFAAAFVVTLALSATRIPSEVERRTVFNVLARDVRRWQYVVGTWAGVFIVMGAAVGAFTVIALAVGGVIYKELMLVLFLSAIAVWFEMGVISAFTVMMSTRVGVVTSVVGAIAFVFVGHSVGALATGGAEIPWYVPSLSVFDVVNAVSYGSGYGLGFAASMTVAFCAWAALLLLAASALLSGRDL
jgi:ABC-type transport system involved in multi-copper enzyme maturation permease subunit